MRNFYYERKSKNIHSIEICYPNQSRECLKEFLLENLGKKESNEILNSIILGESAYCEGNLTIINRQNENVNIKDGRKYLYIKKRVKLKNAYLDYLFKYNFYNCKYELKVTRNEQGIKSDVTELFDEGIEVPKMLEELNILDIKPYISIFNADVCIIDGMPATLEISNDEISLYSSRQSDTPIETLTSQRYLIVKKATKEVVGNIKFAFRETNISYSIREPFQGNHYASKALKLMVELIKDNINFQKRNLYIRIHKDNLASIKTAEACNFDLVDDFCSIQEYVVNPQKILTVN